MGIYQLVLRSPGGGHSEVLNSSVFQFNSKSQGCRSVWGPVMPGLTSRAVLHMNIREQSNLDLHMLGMCPKFVLRLALQRDLAVTYQVCMILPLIIFSFPYSAQFHWLLGTSLHIETCFYWRGFVLAVSSLNNSFLLLHG